MTHVQLITTFILLLGSSALAQSGLSFTTPDTKIDQRFEFLVNQYVYQKIMDISGDKLEVRTDEVRFNHQLLEVKSCKIRGNTTLNFRRKSFSLSLEKPIDFQGVAVKRLAVNNLAMDQNYWRARLCFLLMDQIGIFPLKNQFTELTINEETQGTYLMIQKPEDYCRDLGSSLLARREGNQQLTVEYTLDQENKQAVKILKKVKELCKTQSGKPLYDTLNQVMDFRSYNKWLAFNYLIMNGDYMDELFLFLDPETNRFNILPWDYDDVFASQPHEGQQSRDHTIGNQMLFSTEVTLDVVIASDQFLYQKYLEAFGEVLAGITPEALKKSFEQVYRELAPYFSNPEVIAQSQYDHSGLTNTELLKEDLDKYYQFLLNRRNSIWAKLTIDN